MRDQKGGWVRGAKDFMTVISLLLDSVVFLLPFFPACLLTRL